MMLLREIKGHKAVLAVLCLCVAFATPGQSADNLVQQWGAATNGLRLGLTVFLKDSWGREQPPECIVYAQNVTSNRMDWRLAPESPQDIRLFYPRGQEAMLHRNALAAINRRHHPVAHEGGEVDQLKSFSITSLFDLKTNGIHTLVVSGRATTNVVHGRRNPVFFTLLPVTNNFEIRLPGK